VVGRGGLSCIARSFEIEIEIIGVDAFVLEMIYVGLLRMRGENSSCCRFI
jgi:hypothetical protein